MSRPRAPMALRMPISRVRSRTETSMMFMIPMPPTRSEIEAIPASSRVSRSLTPLTVVSSWAWSAIVKSSVPPGAMLWRVSSRLVISLLTVSIWSAVATLMPIVRTFVPGTNWCLEHGVAG